MKKKQPSPEDILKEIEWSKWLEILIPTLSPLLIAIAWVMLSKFDKKVQTLNSLIAIAEVVPSVDIGLPKGVVLGALYDKGDEAIATMVAIMESLENIPPFVTAELEKLKLLLMQQSEEGYDVDPKDYGWPPDTEPEPPDSVVKQCIDQAVKDLGIAYYFPGLAPAWVFSCLLRKGYKVSKSFVKRKLAESLI
jgi:hypothetical protein